MTNRGLQYTPLTAGTLPNVIMTTYKVKTIVILDTSNHSF